jgi:hypothetical protein
MFGWILDNSIARYPQALTTTEIKNQLGISSTGALNLKRRFQVFCSEQQQKYKELIHRDLKKLTKIEMPALGEDVRGLNAKHRFPTTDTMAVFSASQRVSKGRQRWKAGAKGNGLTSSIYLNSHLGGRQIGSLINTFSIPGRGLILDAIPNQEAGTIGPLIRAYVPRGTPLYSDEGLRWYKRENHNHRMVNHSKKSKLKRYRYAKDRWSVAGVNIQSSEGTHSVLKATLRAYRYIQPRNMPLYLNEFAFLRNVRVYGYSSLFHDRWSTTSRGVGIVVKKCQYS